MLKQVEDRLHNVPVEFLPPRSGMLIYVVARGLITALLVTPGVRRRRIPFSTAKRWSVESHQWQGGEELVQLLSQFETINAPAGPFREGKLRAFCDLSAKVLLKPILPVLRSKAIEQLAISLPGFLSHVPFEALPLENDPDDARRLADEVVVFYLPSLLLGSDLARRQTEAPRRDNKLLAVGYLGKDLPVAAVEIYDRMTEEWAGRITVLDGSRCNKRAVLEELRQPYTHVHFVGHGTFNVVAPLNSALLLERESLQDRYQVLASDILDTDLPGAPVVSMSACSSALTAFGSTNDCTGLTGALLRSGAIGVVGSRWPVYDEVAAEFASQYYSRLAKESTAVEAVHESQRHLRSSGRVENWAAFGYLGVP